MARPDAAATFELATAGRIVFGDGAVSRLPALVRELLTVADGSGAAEHDAAEGADAGGPGGRATRPGEGGAAGAAGGCGRAAGAPGGGPTDSAPVLIVTGREPARHAHVLDGLRGAGLALELVEAAGEPTTEAARAATARARASGARAVVAIGGGSALDLGKAVAALAANDGDALDYLEIVGGGRPLRRPPLPFVAVPTTAGTGSEVTKNAVLSDPGRRVKVSLRSELMLPRLALVDPELTWSVPRDVTAATGMDALVQVIEPFLSHAASPITDALVRDAIPRGARAIRRAVANGRDREARGDMALVSVIGGIALANAKLGAVHGFAGPIGGAFVAPHGAICARLLGPVLRANLAALRARAPEGPGLGRMLELARMVTGEPDARAEDAAAWADALAADLGIPALSTYGMRAADVPALAAAGARASSMKGNPVILEPTELEAILEAALD